MSLESRGRFVYLSPRDEIVRDAGVDFVEGKVMASDEGNRRMRSDENLKFVESSWRIVCSFN